MNPKNINDVLVVVGGTASAVGSFIGYQIGNIIGTPPGTCGWQYVQATISPSELNNFVLGTPVSMFAREQVRVYLGNCGINPWIVAAFFAIPGVIIAIKPLFSKSN